MPVTVKVEPRTHPREPSFVSILSAWAQQGAQSLFATQRILLDLAMRQNANVMHALRQQLSDPNHSPTAILTEMTGKAWRDLSMAKKCFSIWHTSRTRS